MIEIDDGLWIDPKSVTAVKTSPLEPDRCTVFLSGQSSQDGFVVQRDADELAEEINSALGSEQ